VGEFLMYEELTKAMTLLGSDPRTIFLGQTVEYSGSGMYDTLKGVPMDKRLEVGIMEDTQLGMSIGLSLEGYIPISIYPRFDFLILAMNQLVNHLDKISEMSNGEFNPKVIIRTAVGATEPLYPGIQHCSDYTSGFRDILKNVDVIKLDKAEDVVESYKCALNSDRSSLLIEVSNAS